MVTCPLWHPCGGHAQGLAAAPGGLCCKSTQVWDVAGAGTAQSKALVSVLSQLRDLEDVAACLEKGWVR